MSSAQENVPLQVKVFSRWVSNQLVKGNASVQVEDISKDFSNGVALVELAKILTGKEPQRAWANPPAKRVEMIQNCDLSVQMFFEDGVHLIGIAGKDVHDNNVKIIRGYIWTLILRYSIGRATYSDTTNPANRGKSSKDILFHWAVERSSKFQNVRNFQPSALAMCALLANYVPDKIKFNKLNPKDTQHNAQLATNVLKELGVPLYLHPEDYDDNEMDEKALLTQLSAAKIYLEKLPPAPSVKVEENRIISTLSDCIPIEDTPAVQEPPVVQDPSPVESDSDLDEAPQRVKEAPFVSHKVEGNNSQYAGRKFGLVMLLNETDYNDGKEVDLTKEDELLFGDDVEFALTMVEDKHPFLNPAGLKLTITHPDIENNVFQQFTFGQNEWSTVIDSVQQKGMVWDVADQFNLDPPERTPFYLFPFHGRHNQHFVYKDKMIIAKQNGHVVTFIGGDEPLVMMPPSNQLKARQTFTIRLI